MPKNNEAMTAEKAIEYLANKCLAQEPVFILRGSDKLAVMTVVDWIGRAKREGVSEEKIEAAWQQAAAMIKWPFKKRPD